jgi:hypothetical protein
VNAEIRTPLGVPSRRRWSTRLKGGDIALISVHGVHGVFGVLGVATQLTIDLGSAINVRSDYNDVLIDV